MSVTASRTVTHAAAVIGAMLLGIALVAVSAFGITEPTSDLPIPIGLAVGVALAGLGALMLLSWSQQVALFAFLAVAQVIAITVGDTTVQLAVVMLVPLSIRTLLLTSREVRPAWGWPEYLAIAWAVLQFVSTALFAPDVTSSLGTAGLLALGVVAYLVTYTGVCTRDRLIHAVRAMLAAAVTSAVIALGSLAAYYLFGNTTGMANLPGVGLVVRGVAKEPDLLGSTCAAAAVTFFVLAREENPVLKRFWSLLGFWLCAGVMIATLTRGALIAFILGLVIAVVLRRRTPTRGIRLIKVLAPLTGALVLALGALIVVNAQGSSAVSQITEQGQLKIEGLTEFTGSVRQRGNETLIAFDDIDQSPVLGLGSGSFGQRHIDPSLNPPGPGYLGNLYLRTLYDTGVVGLVVYALFLAGVLWPRPTVRRSRAELAPVAWGLIFGSVTLAIAYSATDGSLLVWPWFLLGLVRSAVRLTRIEHGALSYAGGLTWRDVTARPTVAPATVAPTA